MYLSLTNVIFLVGSIGLLVIIILYSVIILKSGRIKQAESAIERLQDSLEQMDGQAKLIVRTDLELNKIQEELDKKISGLYALQKLFRAFASTLDEKEIFNKIKPEHIESLGMQRAFGFIWDNKEKGFLNYLCIGYSHEEIENIGKELNSNQSLYLKLLKERRTVSSLGSQSKVITAKVIENLFKVKVFYLSPILHQEGEYGLFCTGTLSEEATTTEGDAEIFEILSGSIGQALENARLFEATWRAQQESEVKVEQRTKELTEVVQELKNVSKRKSEFVSAVSHELRTPLTSIKGYASILLSERLGDVPEPIKIRLEKINRHSNELVQMVNDLLDISRIESGKVMMKKQFCGLKGLLDDILDLLSLQIKAKNINISQDIQNDLKVFVDKSQIERVFLNLIANAIKFTPEEGTIAVNANLTENYFIQVNISDTGIGIPKEAQKAIFEEFYRIDNPVNEQVKGTGLGLSLVKNIIEAHRGSIWVESQPPKGSTFSFLLPTQATPETPVASTQTGEGK